MGCVGCSSSLFAGDPVSAPGRYVNGRGQTGAVDWPIENQFPTHDAADTQVLDAPPEQAWRPLADVSVSSDNPATVIEQLKQTAASYGADAVVRLAVGAGASKTTSASDTWGFSTEQVGMSGSSSSTIVESRHSAFGTAVRRAEPGTEALLGIGCTNYVVDPDVSAENRFFGYVVSASPPAAPSIAPGDYLLGWMDASGKAGTFGNCVSMNTVLQRHRRELMSFGVWRPGPRLEKQVSVPSTPIIGVVVRDTPEGPVTTRPPHGSPADIAGVRDGDIITRVDGTATKAAGDVLQRVRASSKPTIEVEVSRQGKRLRLRVTPGSWQSVVTQAHPTLGLLVVFALGAKGDASFLAPGDVLLDFDTGASFQAALRASKGKLRVNVRREGMGRSESIQLGTIPDSWYRTRSEKVVRGPTPGVGPGTSKPPDTTPAPNLGCTKDTDCKGDRICVKAECVDAPPTD